MFDCVSNPGVVFCGPDREEPVQAPVKAKRKYNKKKPVAAKAK